MVMVMATVILVVGTNYDDADDKCIKNILLKKKIGIRSPMMVVNSDVKDLEENGTDEPVSAEKRKLVVVLFRSHLRDNRDIFHLKMNFVS